MKADGKNLSRKGLSAPILALILIIVGVALALVAASLAGGFLFGFGAAPKVTIERADVLIDPIGGTGYVTVDVRNSGGSPLTNCEVTEETTGEDIGDPITNLNPGQTGTVTDTIGGAVSGNVYVFRVECTGPGGATVQDQKSAIGHI